MYILFDKIKLIPGIMWSELLRMSWFIILGIVLGALIKTYKLDRKLYKIFNKREISMIFLATFTGIFSPLCSCGILPVVITLIECGVPLAPVMALFITSPIMSPDALVFTYGVLGRDLAIAKVVGASAMGVLSGFATYFLIKIKYIKSDALKIHKYIDSCIVKAKDLEKAAPGEIPIDDKLAENKVDFFLKRAWELTRYMLKFVMIAAFIEALIIVFVPIDLISPFLGGKNLFSPIWATFLGIPLPVNGVSVVPILKGFIENGMGAKAAVSFMIAAPVTSIPAIVALKGMFKHQVVISFIILSIAGSIALGYLLG